MSGIAGKGDREAKKSTSELDEQILSALDDPDISKSQVGGGNLSSQTNFPDAVSGGCNEEESDDYGDDDDDDDDIRNSTMGYVPLPQDSDEDDDAKGEDDDGGGDYGSPTVAAIVKDTLQDDIVSAGCQSSHKESNTITQTAVPKLETKAVEQIKQAMSGFSIPSSSVPEWAKQVPEDIWKEELMKGLKERTKKK